VGGAAARRKGNRAELDVVAALRRHGWQAITSRAARAGTQAGADLITDFPLVVEVKDQARMELAGWVDQAVAEAGGSPACVVHKRRGKAEAEDWYVTMTFGDMLRWLGSPREGEHGTAGTIRRD
jgi:hypothetical protein